MSLSRSVWSLKGISGEFQGNTLPLRSSVMTMGRASENHIMISDNNVSRHHATLFVNKDSIQIMDEKSRNGVLLNEKKIEPGKKITLKHGDRIQIGPHGFVIELDEGGQESPAKEIKLASSTKSAKTDQNQTVTSAPKSIFIDKIKDKLSTIEWNRRTLMYTGLGIFVLMMIIMQIPPSSNNQTAKPKTSNSNVEIKSSITDENNAPLQDSEIDAMKARAKASLQFQDYLAATEEYEKIVKAQPHDEYIKTQYEFSKKQLKRLIERHLEFAKREYEKLNYERAIIEWKQVLALTYKADPEVYKQTEEKIRDAEKEIQKRR